MKGFEVAAGTITGADHQKMGKNNQDAWCIRRSKDLLVAVVADGCSSCAHSEVGAFIGATLTASHLFRELSKRPEPLTPSDDLMRTLLGESLEKVLVDIEILALNMGDSVVPPIRDGFLFTLVGVVMTPALTCTFAAGDGLLAVNGQIRQLGPFPGNQPPYPAYRLLRAAKGQEVLPEGPIEISFLLPTESVNTVFIGTDGAVEITRQANKPLPGKTEVLGPVSQFWENDLFFSNPDAIRRRLFQANSQGIRPDWETRQLVKFHPLLHDDTTMVVLRRGAKKER